MSRLSFEVSIEYPFYQSKKGAYFIGQTPILGGQSQNALAILRNPSDSGRLIYVNAITITNISDSNLSAEFYLRANLCPGSISNQVTCVNTSVCPVPSPVGIIEYFYPPISSPANGVSIFSRIVPPQSTLVVDGGQIILGQMQSLSVYIGGFEPASFEGIRFAFGWSEKELHRCK